MHALAAADHRVTAGGNASGFPVRRATAQRNSHELRCEEEGDQRRDDDDAEPAREVMLDAHCRHQTKDGLRRLARTVDDEEVAHQSAPAAVSDERKPRDRRDAAPCEDSEQHQQHARVVAARELPDVPGRDPQPRPLAELPCGVRHKANAPQHEPEEEPEEKLERLLCVGFGELDARYRDPEYTAREWNSHCCQRCQPGAAKQRCEDSTQHEESMQEPERVAAERVAGEPVPQELSPARCAGGAGVE
eukprot:6150084-Prymnesium_polylepis.1